MRWRLSLPRPKASGGAALWPRAPLVDAIASNLSCINDPEPTLRDEFRSAARTCAVSMSHGVFVMNKYLLALLASWLLLGTVAEARSPYDGQWNITFVTQSGDCNPTYNYSVNIENGVITSPMAETFRGSVSTAGAVRASVAVQDKRASGAGKLRGVRGRGTWTGYSGPQRCAGAWTAERTY